MPHGPLTVDQRVGNRRQAPSLIRSVFQGRGGCDPGSVPIGLVHPQVPQGTCPPPPSPQAPAAYHHCDHPSRVVQWLKPARRPSSVRLKHCMDQLGGGASRSGKRQKHRHPVLCVVHTGPRADRAHASVDKTRIRSATYGPRGREKPILHPISSRRSVPGEWRPQIIRRRKYSCPPALSWQVDLGPIGRLYCPCAKSWTVP